MNLLIPYKFNIESKYNDCSICLKEFDSDSVTAHLMQIPNCEHIFHEACLRRWFL